MAIYAPHCLQLKDGSDVLIRSAREEDAAALLTLGLASIEEAEFSLPEPGEVPRTLQEERDWIRAHQAAPLRIALVAVGPGGEVVGILDFANGHRRRLAHTGEFGIAVKADWRDRGVGGALVRSLLDWAALSRRIEKICLRVHADNARAIALYRKLGFEVEGVQKKLLRYGPGQYVDALWMGRFI